MSGVYWPGPTRLYDPVVDCGAVLLTGGQAQALVKAAELYLLDVEPAANQHHTLRTVIGILRFCFNMKEASDE